MITESKIAACQLQHGFDRLTAWRHLRDQAVLRRRFAYQGERTSWQGKGN